MGSRPFTELDVNPGLAPGARLGPYEIVSPLGAGGMGEVHRARDSRLGREVAIKVLGRHASSDPSRRQRFDREARLASAVSHPHVLTVFDVGEWEGLPYVVTELLEGETLRAHVRPGTLAARQAVGFAVQVAQGLAALHARDIVHRDSPRTSSSPPTGASRSSTWAWPGRAARAKAPRPSPGRR